MAKRICFFIYGAVAYLLFLGTFLYAVGFLWNFMVPKSIDSGQAGPVGQAILVNLLLLGAFGIQHSVMARPAFKKHWTRIIPPPIERSTFVVATCFVLGLMYWQWRPLPDPVWEVSNPAGRTLLFGLSGLGWGVVLYASFRIDHFDLFGLRQVVLYLLGKQYSHPGFATPWIYKLVRNPLMLGFIIAFWSTPDMTQGHLLFAAVATGYILVAIQLEERDLLSILGERYRQYRERTPMLIPLPRWSGSHEGERAGRHSGESRSPAGVLLDSGPRRNDGQGTPE